MAVVERPTVITRKVMAPRVATGTASFPSHTSTGPPTEARTAVDSENIFRALTAPLRGPVYTSLNSVPSSVTAPAVYCRTNISLLGISEHILPLHDCRLQDEEDANLKTETPLQEKVAVRATVLQADIKQPFGICRRAILMASSPRCTRSEHRLNTDQTLPRTRVSCAINRI